MALKQGKNEEFNELLTKAMQASNNVNMISSLDSKIPAISRDNGGVRTARSIIPGMGDVRNTFREAHCTHNNSIDNTSLFSCDNDTIDREHSHLIDVGSEKGRQELVTLLEKLHFKREGEGDNCDCDNKTKAVKTKKEGGGTGNQEKTDNKNKLTSGCATKPDESDIKQQVKFAHEKLDSRHVKERLFDKLNSLLLIAGELELASLPNISMEESRGRVSIAKTIAYHKAYLSDDDLKAGYDTILKQIEQGESTWSDNLGEQLHKLYDYRANVIWREKAVGANTDTKNKLVNDAKNDKKESESGDESPESKLIYCMEYNRGTCPQSKSHVGKWKGKKVTKWHVCRSCLKAGELREHPEGDTKCAKKA